MSRKLASIKEISGLCPIPNRDRIELAMVDGWQVIVKKGEFAVGDKAVFCEIDSVLPSDNTEFAYLSKVNFRIKTMKMAGVISQGLLLSMSILPSGRYNVGDDVTDIMKITKYEPNPDNAPAPAKTGKQSNPLTRFLMRYKFFRTLIGKASNRDKSGFPEFISKTDETRIQNIPMILTDHETRYIVTEKIDGQSGTYVLKRKKTIFGNGFEFIVCSRNFKRKPDDSTYWKVARKYDLKDVLMHLIGDHDDWVCIQGEIIDEGVQGNKYGVKDVDFFVFNLMFSGEGGGRKKQIDTKVSEWLLIEYGLKTVPIIDSNSYIPEGSSVNDILSCAGGESRLKPNVLREGLVFRNYYTNISFKAVSPAFLMKHDE